MTLLQFRPVDGRLDEILSMLMHSREVASHPSLSYSLTHNSRLFPCPLCSKYLKSIVRNCSRCNFFVKLNIDFIF